MKNLLKILSLSLLFVPSLFVALGEARCKADRTSQQNEIYWKNDKGKLVPLPKLRKDLFRLSKDDLGRKRRLRFHGHLKSFESDTPAVIKVSAWSKLKTAKSTKHVFIKRNVRKNGKTRQFRRRLSEYQKHHRGRGRSDSTFLKRNFHYKYKDRDGKFRHTDDTRQKREKFSFDGVSNTYRGGLLTRIFQPNRAIAEGNKYVYLKAVIRDLKVSPCFTFSVSLPRSTDRVSIKIEPIARVNSFGRKRWQLENDR